MWSYAGPQSGPKDQVRFLVGDTRPKDPYLQDEDIAWLLQRSGDDVSVAAVKACYAILSFLARARDETVGSVSIAFSQSYNGYKERLAGLKEQVADDGCLLPFCGGISRLQNQAAYSDDDFVPPDFRYHMMQSPWSRSLSRVDNEYDFRRDK